MRWAYPVLLAASLASPAQADPLSGCYTRSYSADHLARNPDQKVAALALRLFDMEPAWSLRQADITLWLADPAAARQAGIRAGNLTADTLCEAAGQELACGTECGGSLRLRMIDDQVIEIETAHYPILFDAHCQTVIGLDEAGGTTRYRLTRAAPEACPGD